MHWLSSRGAESVLLLALIVLVLVKGAETGLFGRVKPSLGLVVLVLVQGGEALVSMHGGGVKPFVGLIILVLAQGGGDRSFWRRQAFS